MSFKPIMEMTTFQLNFVQEAYLMDLLLLRFENYLMIKYLYDFSVEYNAVDKSDILNIHKYLMV